MNYKVNPVKGTCFKYKNKNPGLVGLMDSCMSICASFSGTTDVYQMDPVCTATCDAYVEKKKHEMFGVGSCDKQSPYRPVIWGENRYLPKLLKSGMNLDSAVNKCFNMCDEFAANKKEECRENCLVDANSVEAFQPTMQAKSDSSKSSACSTCDKGSHVVGISLVLLVAIVLLLVYFYKMKV